MEHKAWAEIWLLPTYSKRLANLSTISRYPSCPCKSNRPTPFSPPFSLAAEFIRSAGGGPGPEPGAESNFCKISCIFCDRTPCTCLRRSICSACTHSTKTWRRPSRQRYWGVFGGWLVHVSISFALTNVFGTGRIFPYVAVRVAQ